MHNLVEGELTCDNRGDPYGIEAHALDIIEFRLEALEGAAAVTRQVTTRIASVAVVARNAVRQGEVDAPGFPGLRVRRRRCGA